MKTKRYPTGSSISHANPLSFIASFENVGFYFCYEGNKQKKLATLIQLKNTGMFMDSVL